MNKRILKIVVFAMFVIMLGGCIAPLYKQPVSGSRAKVRFALVSRENGATNIYIRPAGTSTPCKGNSLIAGLLVGKGVMSRTKHKSLNIPLNPVPNSGKNAYTDVYVPAGKRFEVAMLWNDGLGSYYHYCNVAASFIPKNHGMYEVLNVVRGGKCGISVLDIVQYKTGGFTTIQDQTQRQERTCPNGGSFF